MPFRSKAQRAFMFANHPGIAKEFEDATSPNAHLPEHVQKMAEGGEVKEGDEFTEGVKSGVNHDLDGIKKMYDDFMNKHQFGTFPKLENGMKSSSDTAKGYADGGEVDGPDFLKGLINGSIQPQDEPAAPRLSDVARNLNTIPDTNYSFYGDVGADQRAQLYKQLLDKQNSGGNLLAQAAGGIGDAISNSFGGQHNKFQDEAAGIAAKNTENRIGAMDTQRAQKLQDLQGNQEMVMNDPNHPIAKSMQQTLKAAGLNVPSGMPASVMLKVAGPLGDFALKKATIGVQEQVANQNQTNQVAQRRQEAAKGLENRPWYQKMAELIPGAQSDSTKEFQNELGTASQPHGIPDLGSTFNGGKVLSVKKVK